MRTRHSLESVRWPRPMLLPGELRRVCRRDRRTEGRTTDRYITLSARRGQREKEDEHPPTLLNGVQYLLPSSLF